MSDFQLVAPFILCQSEGGPYDDEAFVAGFQCGMAHVALAHRPAMVVEHVKVAVIPQLDLLAMAAGYVTRTSDAGMPEGWTLMTFTRPPELSAVSAT